MNASFVVLMIFLGLASACAAVAFLLRDLASSRAGPASPPLRLRRLPRAPQAGQTGGPVAAFDHWFIRLVRETGLALTPTEGALAAVLGGAILASAIFLWKERPILAALGMAVGMIAVIGYLAIRRAKRIRLLQEQLPAALDMLARSLRAGQSVDESFQLVGARATEPLAAEFRFCANQLAMGLSMPAVMRSLVDRVRLFDVRIFTTTLAVHREAGGNIAKVLERLSAVIRDRLNYRRQLRAVTGAGRFSAGLIALIGPLLFAYLLYFHPQYLQAMTDSPMGQSLLTIAITLEVVGLIWIARLLRPSY